MKEYGISSGKVRILDTRIVDQKGCTREIYRECRNIIELAIGAVDIDKIEMRSYKWEYHNGLFKD